jgi:flagellar P-ring protein precursor FlgI
MTTMRSKSGQLAALSLVSAALLAACSTACAARIKNLCEIQGARGNTLRGIGIVVGLDDTGDRANDAIRAQEEILRRMGVEVAGRNDLSSSNVAIVAVTATFPPYAKEGTRIDVNVSSLYDAESLEGGLLLETLLEGIDGSVYAVAQGPLSIGGFNADAGGGNEVRENHVTAGRIPMGAFIEREIPSTITDGERIMLLLKKPDFGTAQNIQAAINQTYGANTASAMGAGTVGIVIPMERRTNLVSFIADVENIEVVPDVRSRVVINERTGTLVVGGEVTIRPCHVAHGSLTIRVSSVPVISQPLPFAERGRTVVTEDEVAEVEEVQAHVMPLGGTTAAEVAEGLNRLKVTPRDMITIFQALREAGVMDADLEIM